MLGQLMFNNTMIFKNPNRNSHNFKQFCISGKWSLIVLQAIFRLAKTTVLGIVSIQTAHTSGCFTQFKSYDLYSQNKLIVNSSIIYCSYSVGTRYFIRFMLQPFQFPSSSQIINKISAIIKIPLKLSLSFIPLYHVNWRIHFATLDRLFKNKNGFFGAISTNTVTKLLIWYSTCFISII